MSSKVAFKIGDREYSLGPLSIWSLEQAWPTIGQMSSFMQVSPPTRGRMVSTIIAAGLANDLTVIDGTPLAGGESLTNLHGMDDGVLVGFITTNILRQMNHTQLDDIFGSFTKLMEISGFAPEGEAKATT